MTEVIPEASEDSLEEHQFVIRGLCKCKFVQKELEDAWDDFCHALDVLKQAVEE